MKKIAFLIPTLEKGGAERVVSILSLKMNDFEKYLILFEKKIDYPYLAKEIIDLKSPAEKNFFLKIYRFFERIFKLKKIKKKYNFDIVISFLESANFVNVLAKEKEKTIISVHEAKYKLPFRKNLLYYDLLIKLLYNKADFVVTVSKGVKECLIKNFGIKEEKIKIIYNPIDLEKIKLEVKENNLKFENYIINIGRLTGQKGQWHLLRIFKEVKKEIPDLKLLILGEGELKDYFWNLSQKLGFKTYLWENNKISENFDVYFLGFQKNPFRYLAKAKLFILTSFWEGFPNVLIEALACAVPVISSDCRSGPREILAPNTDHQYQTKELEFGEYGILMPVLDGVKRKSDEPLTLNEKKWVEIIKKMIKDTNLQKKYSSKTQERIKDFSVEKIIRKWQEFFKQP